MAHVALTLNGEGLGDIYVDDTPIRSCQGVTLDAPVGERPTVQLDLNLRDGLDLELGGAEVTVPDKTHSALVALGWTPPERS